MLRYRWRVLRAVGRNVFVYHSLNDGNLYEHDADSNQSRVVMDESIFVRLLLLLLRFLFLDFANSSDRHSRNFYQKLSLMHVTKIVRFDWSAVFESCWYKKTYTE